MNSLCGFGANDLAVDLCRPCAVRASAGLAAVFVRGARWILLCSAIASVDGAQLFDRKLFHDISFDFSARRKPLLGIGRLRRRRPYQYGLPRIYGNDLFCAAYSFWSMCDNELRCGELA